LGWVFGVKLSDEDIADFEVLRDVAMATIFLAFYIWDAHWRHLANSTEPPMCGGDAALCQITLSTCYYRDAVVGAVYGGQFNAASLPIAAFIVGDVTSDVTT